jgi:broad specificity phosphatase PhoE
MIILVRHGRTDANARGLLLGRADPELDDEGRAQAGCLAAALATADISRMVTSPLVRCRQTADAVAAPGTVRRPVAVDDRWVELDYGSLDGVGTADVPAATWAAWRADVEWAPEGGESLAALGARVRSACESLADEAATRDVVVVTHVSPVKAAAAWALGVGDEISWRLWVAPASITRISVAGPAPTLRSFNEVGHLS